MVKSATLRKIVILASFVVVIGASIAYSGTFPLSGLAARLVRTVAAFMLLASTTLVFAIHSSYLEEHEKPNDFSQLLLEGPYSLCRHPFYLLLIISQLSIAVYSLSLQGLLVFIVASPIWYVLIRVEEAELLDHFGDKYKKYMRDVPALLPLGKRKIGAQLGRNERF